MPSSLSWILILCLAVLCRCFVSDSSVFPPSVPGQVSEASYELPQPILGDFEE